MKILIEESVLQQWKDALSVSEPHSMHQQKWDEAIASMQSHLDASEKVEPFPHDNPAVYSDSDCKLHWKDAATKRPNSLLHFHPAPAVRDYAWPTVQDYERDIGFETNFMFKSGWNIARTTNRMLSAAPTPPTKTDVDLNPETFMRLIETIKYMVGIAERGRGYKCPDDVQPEKFLLEYVIELEAPTNTSDSAP